jgi:hypothetical protein
VLSRREEAGEFADIAKMRSEKVHITSWKYFCDGTEDKTERKG